MIKLELVDHAIQYHNLDRVISIRSFSDGGLLASLINAEGKSENIRCIRFQIIKEGSWYN